MTALDNSEADLTALRVKVAELCGDLIPPTHKPKIDELEALLNSSDKLAVTIMPNGEVRALRDYPNDLNAAFELCKTLVLKTWQCSIHNADYQGVWNCRFWKGGVEYEATDDSLATAICRAFIATMEASKTNEPDVRSGAVSAGDN